MASKQLSKQKLIFGIFFLMYYCCKQCHTKFPENLKSLDIDQIGKQIMSNPKVMNLFRRSLSSSLTSNSRYDTIKCAFEIDTILESFQNADYWTMKLFDSWGGVPQGIFSGNLYSFGAFSQCFQIEKNEIIYPTQYCLARIVVDPNDFLTSPKLSNNTDLMELESFIPMIAVAQNIDIIKMAMPSHKNGLPITIGICLPDVCSPNMIAELLNILKMNTSLHNIQIDIPESVCQFEKNITQMNILDEIAIILLVIVIFLMVSSTYHDLRTINDEPKSQRRIAFSVYTNGMKLFSYKAGTIPCLEGIRAISAIWCVLSHSFLFAVTFPLRNKIDVAESFAAYQNVILLGGETTVDTFFLLSGLMITIYMLNALNKSRGRINIPMLYIHRYLRLTPMLAITILYTITLLRFFGNGPIWPAIMQFFKGQCVRNWWATLLYVQNYLNADDICLLPTWYLSADTQLFFIAPFVVYFIYFFKLKAIFALMLSIFGCIGLSISIYLIRDITVIDKFGERMVLTYFPTHTRFMPWMIGIFLGYFLHNSDRKQIRIPRFVNLLGWIVTMTLMTAVISSKYPISQVPNIATPLQNALADCFSRLAWPIAISYIIFACVHNYGGPVNWFLSHPIWQPLSKLSYTIYLAHFSVVMSFFSTLKSVPYYYESNVLYVFIGNLMMTILVSLFAYLAFEAPLAVIEKSFLQNLLSKPKKAESSLKTTPQNEIEVDNGKLS